MVLAAAFMMVAMAITSYGILLTKKIRSGSLEINFNQGLWILFTCSILLPLSASDGPPLI